MRFDEQAIKEWKTQCQKRWSALDAQSRRKLLMLAAAVILLLLVLLSPSCPPQGRMGVMGAGGMGRGVAPAPQQPLLGRWSGREALANRGVCTLALEVKADSSAFSTMSCNGEVNTTGVRYRWSAARAGDLTLKPLFNAGVAEALYGCEVTWMTLRELGTNRAAVQWGERKTSSSPFCTDGEMLLAR